MSNTNFKKTKEESKKLKSTEIVFILDRSGSMCGLEKDTIGGFNSMVKEQKQLGGKCMVSTVLFDNVSEVLHDRLDIENIPEMTERDYTVRGCTALLDAIGDAVHHIGTIHKYARKEDVPEKTIFFIITDGMENASRRYDYKRTRAIIERQKSKYGWEFIFIGANIDAESLGEDIGINPEMAVNYIADKQGTETVYAAVNDAVREVRSTGYASSAPMMSIKRDYKNRSGNVK